MTTPSTDPWTLDPAAFPQDGTFDAKAKHLISIATLAPSGHNTQPWLFRVVTGAVLLFADRTRALPVVDPHDRELTISCGAALETLTIAARHFGYRPAVTLSPDPTSADLLARIDLRVTGAPDKAAARRFCAIPQRRTSRAAFLPTCPEDALVQTCFVRAAEHGIRFSPVSEPSTRADIAALVARGDQLQFQNPAFRRELAAWVHSSRSASRDGMSGSGFGMPDILSPVGRFVIRTFDLGNGVAAADEKKITSATPMLGILSSAVDDQDNWTNTGRALAGVLLELTAAGFTASYLNQPIETDALRPQLAAVAHLTDHPQILLRLGKTEELPAPTVRRAVRDVVMDCA